MLCVNLYSSLWFHSLQPQPLPANATLADRKSDEGRSEHAQPAPYSGQIVIRGEIQDRDAKNHSAKPAPYSGQIVIRGQVQPESHG